MDDLYDILKIRSLVFNHQQRLIDVSKGECMEIDDQDQICTHLIGRLSDNQIAVTARLFTNKTPLRLGRLAVNPNFQKHGIGTQNLGDGNIFWGNFTKGNQLGYGKKKNELQLNLVYNPINPILPPPQDKLENDYKKILYEKYKITFKDKKLVTGKRLDQVTTFTGVKYSLTEEIFINLKD